MMCARNSYEHRTHGTAKKICTPCANVCLWHRMPREKRELRRWSVQVAGGGGGGVSDSSSRRTTNDDDDVEAVQTSHDVYSL